MKSPLILYALPEVELFAVQETVKEERYIISLLFALSFVTNAEQFYLGKVSSPPLLSSCEQ